MNMDSILQNVFDFKFGEYKAVAVIVTIILKIFNFIYSYITERGNEEQLRACQHTVCQHTVCQHTVCQPAVCQHQACCNPLCPLATSAPQTPPVFHHSNSGRPLVAPASTGTSQSRLPPSLRSSNFAAQTGWSDRPEKQSRNSSLKHRFTSTPASRPPNPTFEHTSTSTPASRPPIPKFEPPSTPTPASRPPIPKFEHTSTSTPSSRPPIPKFEPPSTSTLASRTPNPTFEHYSSPTPHSTHIAPASKIEHGYMASAPKNNLQAPSGTSVNHSRLNDKRLEVPVSNSVMPRQSFRTWGVRWDDRSRFEQRDITSNTPCQSKSRTWVNRSRFEQRDITSNTPSQSKSRTWGNRCRFEQHDFTSRTPSQSKPRTWANRSRFEQNRFNNRSRYQHQAGAVSSNVTPRVASLERSNLQRNFTIPVSPAVQVRAPVQVTSSDTPSTQFQVRDCFQGITANSTNCQMQKRQPPKFEAKLFNSQPPKFEAKVSYYQPPSIPNVHEVISNNNGCSGNGGNSRKTQPPPRRYNSNIINHNKHF